MNILSNNELSEICNHLGKSSPKNISQIYGGNIHQSWRLEFKDSSYFIKKNIKAKKFLKFEEHCLNDLRRFINYENLIIPEVIKYFEINNSEILIMEWIDMNNKDHKKLGRGLAEMHIQSNDANKNNYGYAQKGYIGTIDQIEGWETNWSDCFINLRIKPQLAILKDGLINDTLKQKITNKIKFLLKDHKPFCSLIHGDLWSGNKAISKLGKGIIFDPACWWADSEIDIAMTKLFGGFSKDFYNEYYKILKNKKGFENRITIYNFYHILNHTNMFGGSYLQQTYEYAKEILRM
tara:strand:+ start:5025 stop:5903 length:879 start_codon:yes stop_codon:yes gene_type:complete